MNVFPFPIDDDMKAHLNALENARYTGTSGGGFVKVTLSFHFECVRVEIDPAMTDTELLSEFTCNAFNEAVEAVTAAQQNMKNMLMGSIRSLVSEVESRRQEHDSCDCIMCDKNET